MPSTPQLEITTPQNKRLLFFCMTLVALTLVITFLGWDQTRKQNLALEYRVGTADAARVQAESQKATAVAHTKDAENQAQTALARQLSAQAQALFVSESAEQIPAVLLAIQSMRLVPSGEASQTLQKSTLAYLVWQKQIGSLSSTALSPDGKYVATSGWDKTIRVWETLTGKEIAQMTYAVDATFVAFSPDGHYILSVGCDQSNDSNSPVCIQGSVRVWEISTGKEVARMTHPDKVYYAAFSPDGKYVVSGGCDRLLREHDTYVLCADGFPRVWQASTGKEIARLKHGEYVTFASFSPDGKYILSGGCEKQRAAEFYVCTERSVRVWEILSGKEISRITYFPKSYHQRLLPASFSTNASGQYLLSAQDSLVRVSDALTGKEIVSKNYPAPVTLIVFSPDGQSVLCIAGSTVYVWATTTGEEIISRYLTQSLVQSAPFATISPDGKFLLTVEDKTVRIWEMVTGREIATRTDTNSVSFATFSPDSQYVFSGGGKAAHVWGTSTGNEIASMITDDLYGIYGAMFGPDGQSVLTQIGDAVSLWKFPAKEKADGPLNKYPMAAMAFSSSGKYVASVNEDNAWVWEAATGKVIFETNTNNAAILTSTIAFSKDERYIAVGEILPGVYSWEASQHAVSVMDALTGNEIVVIPQDYEVNSIVFSPDGKYLAAGIVDGKISISDVSTGKETVHLKNIYGTEAIAFSPDGKYLASGNDSATISLFEVSSGKEIVRLKDVYGATSIAFSPDGKRLAVAERPAFTVRVWEIFTGKEIAQMNTFGHVFSIAFSPNGKYVIAGGWKAAYIWEAATGQELARLIQNVAIAVAFRPMPNSGIDGNTALVGSVDDTVRVWTWSVDDWIADACSRVMRNLTRAEWQEYIGDRLPYQAVCPNWPIETEPNFLPPIMPTPVP